MERNIMGELDMYRQAGTKPNFSEVARRYGLNHRTVAKYWKSGGQIEDARTERPSAFDAVRDVIEEKAALPGATKKAIHEYLLDRHADKKLPGYKALTTYMLRRDIVCSVPDEGADPHPRYETPPGERLQFDRKESIRMHDVDGVLYEFNVLSATLGYSRLHRFRYSVAKTTDDLLGCLLSVMISNSILDALVGGVGPQSREAHARHALDVDGPAPAPAGAAAGLRDARERCPGDGLVRLAQEKAALGGASAPHALNVRESGLTLHEIPQKCRLDWGRYTMECAYGRRRAAIFQGNGAEGPRQTFRGA